MLIHSASLFLEGPLRWEPKGSRVYNWKVKIAKGIWGNQMF
jgi:hypothetical protein